MTNKKGLSPPPPVPQPWPHLPQAAFFASRSGVSRFPGRARLLYLNGRRAPAEADAPPARPEVYCEEPRVPQHASCCPRLVPPHSSYWSHVFFFHMVCQGVSDRYPSPTRGDLRPPKRSNIFLRHFFHKKFAPNSA